MTSQQSSVCRASTASLWVREIKLTEAQRLALVARNPAYNGQLKGAAANAELARLRRRRYRAEGRRRMRQGDPSFAAGCMLYWAEGSKNRNVLRFSNSDQHMMRFFVEFLREHFDVEDRDFRVWCNLYADHAARQREVEDFWLTLMHLPRSSLHKTTVNSYSRYSRRKRRNMLPYGTCRVSVGSTQLVQTIFGAIEEFAGFHRPEWLG